ncbi:MAG: hypothetical protein GY869_23880, partial [Planctomycetes bacterium]|nr:hypothetical protein [Planctomycetota bacterium]
MFKPTKHLIMLLMVAAAVFSIPGVADAQSKRPLNHDDYDNWVTIRGSGLSPDGQWVFYSTASRNEDQPMLTVKNIDDNDIYQGIAVSGTPQFTYDSKYLVYNLAPPKEKEEEATEEEAAEEEEDKPAPKPKLTLLRLEDGEITTIEKVQSFRLPAESGDWLAYIERQPEKESEEGEAGEAGQAGRGGRGGRGGQRAAQRGQRQRGGQRRQIAETRGDDEADEGDTVFLKSLVDDRTLKLENVDSYQFTTDGAKVIYTAIDNDDPDRNGVFVFNLDNEETRSLLTGEGKYAGFTFDEDENRYALVTTRDDPEPNDAPWSIYGGMLDRGRRARRLVSAETTDGFPENMAPGRSVSFQSDNVITFTIDYNAETKKKMKEEYDKNKDQSEANFELWHWNDPYPYPQQKSMVGQMQRTSRTAILHLEDRVFAVLTDEKISSVSFDDNATIGVANDRTPYTKMVSYDGTYNDVYLVDTETGDRRKIKEMLRASARLSPNGKYLSWFVKDHYYVYDIANRITTNITENLDVNFYREDHDTPQPAGGYGIAGWTDDDET